MGKRSRRLKRAEHNQNYLRKIGLLKPQRLLTVGGIVSCQYDPESFQNLLQNLNEQTVVVSYWDWLPHRLTIMSPGTEVWIEGRQTAVPQTFKGYLSNFKPAGFDEQGEPQAEMTLTIKSEEVV
jgi:hypothetical protein